MYALRANPECSAHTSPGHPYLVTFRVIKPNHQESSITGCKWVVASGKAGKVEASGPLVERRWEAISRENGGAWLNNSSRGGGRWGRGRTDLPLGRSKACMSPSLGPKAEMDGKEMKGLVFYSIFFSAILSSRIYGAKLRLFLGARFLLFFFLYCTIIY